MNGLNLKIERIKKGLSQKQLASMLGVTNQTISDYERCKISPSLSNMEKYVKYLILILESYFLIMMKRRGIRC